MTLELPREVRDQAITSIERWFREERDEKIGNITAGALLNYFLAEIGPVLYNRGVADAQERIRARVDEVDIDVHEDEFGHWQAIDAAARKTRR